MLPNYIIIQILDKNTSDHVNVDDNNKVLMY